MSEGVLNLVVNNPTGNARDGTFAKEVTGTYPINVIVETKTANHSLYKAALRCDEGFKTTGPWEISFIGSTATTWTVADDDNYASESEAEMATYSSVLTGSSVITDKNHIIWLKASTNGEEESTVDTSVSVRLWGRVVPA